MKDKREKSINYILVFVIIFFFVAIIGYIIRFFCKKENDDSSRKNKIEDYGMNSNKMLKNVMLGKEQFYYCTSNGSDALYVSDVTKLFDQEDTYMKIWEVTVTDLDDDGIDEAIIFVTGPAGDIGGKFIFHQIDDSIYGYKTNYRTLLDLKKDGTYSFSDPTGLREAGIARITCFTKSEYVEEKIAYEIGTYKGWERFWINQKNVSEEEYNELEKMQQKKENVIWYNFTRENLITLLDYPE